MNTDIKQAMHVEAGKSFGTAEANENERHWNDDKIDRKNQDPTNHYDKTRMKLNFEIGPDGKVHPLGYQEKSLEVRLQERLTELGWKPFKPDSKIQPNCCAKFIFGGNHERTLEMAFGTQTVNLDKGADNSHLQRCPEIEQWAKDVYAWCAKRYGQKNRLSGNFWLVSFKISYLCLPLFYETRTTPSCHPSGCAYRQL